MSYLFFTMTFCRVRRPQALPEGRTGPPSSAAGGSEESSTATPTPLAPRRKGRCAATPSGSDPPPSSPGWTAAASWRSARARRSTHSGRCRWDSTRLSGSSGRSDRERRRWQKCSSYSPQRPTEGCGKWGDSQHCCTVLGYHPPLENCSSHSHFLLGKRNNSTSPACWRRLRWAL